MRSIPTFLFTLLLPAALLLGCDGTRLTNDDVEPDEGPPEGWTLVWEDNFDGTSLSSDRWDIQVGDGCPDLCGWGNNELQWYSPSNIDVGDGLLTITAREEEAGGRDYTAARIRTINKGDWTYGRFEVRARLPIGQGMWPAIWMLPTDEVYGTWAASGEIDIMELTGDEPDKIFGTLHYGDTFPANVFTGTDFRLLNGTFADDFYEFAIEWEEGEIRWYINDTLYATQTEWSTAGAPFPAPFDQRFHLILNIAVGGNLPGNPDETTVFPQTMEVDYVRVYERTN
ncbi:MAG: glycoside hydrolase family 16 protein [Bacteroidota bacterium]